MNISYIPQLAKEEATPLSFVLPNWIASPLSALRKENKVLVIHTDPALPCDLATCIIAELAVFDRKRTMLYSMKDTNLSVVRKLMDLFSGAVITNNPDLLRYSKTLSRATDGFKMIEKSKLYISDKLMSVDELLADIKKRIEEADKPTHRHRIIMVDDLLSIKGMVKDGEIDKDAAKLLIKSLKEYSAEYKNSYVIMSETPLHKILPKKSIASVYVTMQGKEYKIETL